ncbi:UNVERIFIED_CONTAM: LRR receptor-like serine/threonine-protein kinase [Sesamum radiatum]|uniref:LRR receptor-like serine/threonine-protein kinase n=1 Tax=Sesamum radiatum TaxID=300843 RepID=A0AAW2KJT4_SESRA
MLFDNQLSGEIPKSIGKLSSLEALRAGGNQNLKGELPLEIGNCTNLVVLGLAETGISGSLPSSIGRLKRIQTIAIYTSLLSGPIPEEIGDCTELQNLYLYQNSITGSIPRRIGELRKLQSLLLWQNSLVGTIPAELGSCTDLRVVDLSENLLTGSIPTSFGSLFKLEELQLSVNQLSGTIPSEITNCTALTHLEVDNNEITGEIPVQIGKLTSLNLFFAWKNNLTGNIPESLSECENLQALDLSYNQLFGLVPRQIFALTNLTKLLLISNNLTGFIPPDIGNCTNLYRFRISGNRLGGTVPSEIGKLKSLNFLDMSNNRLVGGIPPSISGVENLEFLDLHSNALTGPLPDTLPKSLQFVDISDNRLTGDIPKELGQLPSLEISLNLSCNQLTGEIPSEFSDLDKLGNLDLSYNKLSGKLDILKNLQNLVSLNVSFNEFSGDLPNTPFFRKLPLSDLAGNKDLEKPHIVKRYRDWKLRCVYKVTIPDGETLAVKKMWSSEESGAFSSEIRTLGSIRHKNILELILHGAGKGGAEWEARYDVILGIAHALAYLHHDCVPPIMHGDVKAMNVLLGPRMEPYLADFGLARLVNSETDKTDTSKQSQRPHLAGSYGYMAPEHASMQRITEKSDIYSFGVVLLEVLTGRHPLDPTLPGGAHLVQWVRDHLNSKRDPVDILDPKLRGRADPQMHEMLQTLAVAFLCLSTRADDRPMMKDVVAMLKEIRYVDPVRPDADMLKGSLSAAPKSPPPKKWWHKDPLAALLHSPMIRLD